jgi:PAS domain-containing protein
MMETLGDHLDREERCAYTGTQTIAPIPGHKIHLPPQEPAVTDMLSIVDRNGTFLYADNATLSHLNLSRVELVGHTLHELFPLHVAARRMRMVRKVLSSGKTVCFLDRRRALCYQSTLAPLKDEDGHADIILVSVRLIATLTPAGGAIVEPEDRNYVWERA